MIWDDDDDLLGDDDLLDGEALEPVPGQDGSSGWRPVPMPPLGTGPFEIVAEETRHAGTPLQTTRQVVLATASSMARAYDLCQRLNAHGGSVVYFFRAVPKVM